MTEETPKPVKTMLEKEAEKQTKLLDAINGKLGLFVFVLILYIIISVLGFIFGM